MGWTLHALFDAAGLTPDLRGDAEVSGLAYDSRAVKAGDAFFCWPGEHADGHDFAPAAVAAGAAALVVERFVEVDVPQARVGTVRDAMGPLASALFGAPSSAMAVAGITGTNGKTTITYLLESIALVAGSSPGVIGTVSRRYADHVEPAPRGLPEAIDLQRLLREMADAGVGFVALEATSDGIEQGRLRGTKLTSAGFTNLTPDHLNTHGSMDAYFEAKASLFDPSYTSQAVINIDDAYGRVLADRVRTSLDVMTFGMKNGDVVAVAPEFTPMGTTSAVMTPAGSFGIATPLVGAYNLSNCLCAIGMALQCGFSLEDIARGIGELSVVPGRLESIDEGQPFLALVDYAHTPDALEQALRACRALARGRLIVVFGCGGDRDRTKRPLMGQAATSAADLSFVTSDNPRSEDPQAILDDIEPGAKAGGGAYRMVPDRREAIEAAIADAGEGDVVLVAGKGHEQGQQFADHTTPFDDRDVVRHALKEVACPS